MKKIVLFIAFITIQLSFGQNTVEKIDEENRKCHENSIPATISSVKCEKEALASWKKLMEEILGQLKATPEKVSVKLLMDSQTHWLKFQKADLAFYAAFYHKQYEGGTMTMAATASHEKQQYRERTIYLLDFLELLQEQ
ncbi:lysozyme inhibitor LprI [Kordia sp. SMS9]|uniref:lysozyme inhibitor LprI family protein n=1 Tax=Kordia sp. SMS9 TaxID=2282170 RepID=UPI000E0E08B9|nr:lysozyme inhibitor LprI family protein [Kordia sp. SMS9]AXG69851.1 lysozyme inhibitor LprI [Kordia sp. SMS9]